MHTAEKIRLKLDAARGEFVRKCQEQGEFWCPICNKWLVESAMYQIVGHSPPDRIVIFGLCQPCTGKAEPDYVGAALGAIRERGNKIERVDSRLKFLLKDQIFKK